MKSTSEEIASIERTDRAMLRLALVLIVCVPLAFFVDDFLIVLTVGLLLACWAVLPWARAEFKAWDRGGHAGDIERAHSDSTPSA